MITKVNGKARSREAAFHAGDAREQNLIGKRLQEERKARKYSLDDVSALLEAYGVAVQRGAVSKWELGTTVPNAYQLLALCSAYGIEDAVAFFSGTDLLDAAGRKKVAEYRDDLIASGRYAPRLPAEHIPYVSMPVSLLSASAGTGNFLDDENFETVEFPANTVPEGADFGIRVNGDSMEPVYADGQTVWVKECSSLRPGETGLFLLNGSGYIKVYGEQEPEERETYTDSCGVLHMQAVLISYNPRYRPITVGCEDSLQIVGKVL